MNAQSASLAEEENTSHQVDGEAITATMLPPIAASGPSTKAVFDSPSVRVAKGPITVALRTLLAECPV